MYKRQVECHYEGTLIDGTKFDSSYDRGQTATFPLNQVIAGMIDVCDIILFLISYNSNIFLALKHTCFIICHKIVSI